MVSFLRFPFLGRVAAAFLGLASAGCDPGYVEAVFLYKGDPPVLGPDATTFARVERRTDPLKPGEPVTTVATSPYAQHGGPIPTIPYGDNLVIIIEVRLSADPNGQVVLYGISDRFSVSQGDHIRVPILLHPRSPPEPLPGEGSLVIVTSTRAPGYTNQRQVELYLFAPESAVKARVSNLVDLPEDGSRVFELARLDRVESATVGYAGYRVAPWTLDVASCLPDTSRCRVNVYTRFIDNQEYSGPPATASVIYDDVRPSLVAGLTSIFPPVARDDVRISINVTASETIFSPRLWVAQRVDFPLVRESPTDDRPSSTFTFSSTRTAGAIGRDGTFLVRAEMTDLAGNIARNVDVGQFTVDRKPIVISRLTITPEHIGAGDDVTARFTYDEDLGDGAGLSISFLGEPWLLDEQAICTITGAAPSLEVTCTYRVTGLERDFPVGSELPASVIVEALDAAGNFTRAISDPVLVDNRAPDILPSSVAVEIVPSPDNFLFRIPGPRPLIDRATVGTTVFVNVVLDEVLAADPALTTVPGGLSFGLIRRAGASFSYAYTLPDGPYTQGLYQLELIATDDVGNVGRHVLPMGFEVDTERPSAPNTVRIRHRRVPWGSDATGDGATASVETSTGAVEPNATVAILAEPSLANFNFLGSTRADAQGGFARFTLDRTEDHREVFAVAIDSAGNPSLSTSGSPDMASRVRRGTEVMSLRGKIPGQSSPNPHDVRMIHELESTLAQDPVMITAADAAAFAQIAGTDGQVLSVSTIRRWENIILSATQPTPREVAAMAYDSMRGVAVMFGGFGLLSSSSMTPQNLRDTWEYDSRRWSSVSPVGPIPSARYGHAMAYDALRGRVVLFGGDDNSRQNDTWEWDGRAWVEMQPQTRPPRRRNHNLVYDSEHGRVLLFGGEDEVLTPSGLEIQPKNDLWSWDGQNWTLLEDCSASTCPDARSVASMIFVPATQLAPAYALLLGGVPGVGGGDPFEDAWVWDGASWTLSGNSNVPAREGAVYVYDTADSVAVFFGGLDLAGDVHNDTWTEGQQRMTYNPPQARAYAASAFDVRRPQVIVFGGRGENGLLADTWAWRGLGLMGGWRNVTPGPEHPDPRSGHAMAYDSATRQVVLFGGATDGATDVQGDTWMWNGARWSPGPTRAVRQFAAMARSGSCTLLFGGDDGTTPYQGTELWSLTDWHSPAAAPSSCSTNASATDQPSARMGSAMTTAFLSTILFGGDSGGFVNDTWEWSDSGAGYQWTLRSAGGPTVQPSGRRGHALAARGTRVVLFGGDNGAGAVGDTWEWHGNLSQWLQVQQTAQHPEARSDHAMSGDDRRQRVVLFGGLDSDESPLADTWEWDGSTWTQLMTRGEPDRRSGHAMAYDADRRRVVLFGGIDRASDPLEPEVSPEVWELHADPDQRPGIEASFDWSTLGVDLSFVQTINLRAAAGGQGSAVSANVSGAELAMWNARLGRWQILSVNAAPPSAPAAFSRTLSTTNDIRSAVTSENGVRVLVRAAAGIGSGADAAQVAADGVELEVSYEFPD